MGNPTLVCDKTAVSLPKEAVLKVSSWRWTSPEIFSAELAALPPLQDLAGPESKRVKLFAHSFPQRVNLILHSTMS